MILSALLAVSSVRAESSITKPSVPEFTVKFVDHSYDVPSTTSIDPYTGKTVTNPSYHVQNKTIEVTIKNQPFIPQNDSNGNPLSLFYNARMKGHYAENWTELYTPEGYPTQSEAKYTVITYLSRDENTYELGHLLTDFPPNARVDFQVQALIGYTYAKHYSDDGQFIPFAPWVFTGETSGWSSTQTLTIDTNQSTSTPNTSPSPMTSDATTPTQPSSPQTSVLFGLDWLQVTVVALLVVIAVLLGSVVMYLRKRSMKSPT